MTMILPFLLMILHFSQIFLTEGLTFILIPPINIGYFDLNVILP